MNPIAAVVDDNEFVSTIGLADAGGVSTRRDADGFFMHQRAAQGISGGEGNSERGKKKNADKEGKTRDPRFHKILDAVRRDFLKAMVKES